MRHALVLAGSVLLSAALVLGLTPAGAGRALPEYAAQTAEPCFSCHVSPSGGGPRGPRGQAWVAAAKPAQVPDLTASLDLLGVELTVDPAFYTDVTSPLVPPAAPSVSPAEVRALSDLLRDYAGN